MNKDSLCQTCSNRDVDEYLRNGNHVEEPVCVFGRAAFPKAFQCDVYEPTYGDEDDDD